MRLDWLIPCTSVTIKGGLAAIQQAGIDRVTVDELPVEVRFVVLLRVVGLPNDFLEESPREAEAYLLGPGMEPLVSLQFEIPPGDPPDDLPDGWELATFLPVGIRFVPRVAGAHMLDVYLNGKHQKGLPVTVRTKRSPSS